ncbi:MAG: YqjF family protein [Nitriliruptoraceae bacterium]
MTCTEPISIDPTAAVVHPLLRMRWEALTYLHWALPPDAVARRLPRGLEPDLHDGRAYVGLVPFRMAGIRLGSVGERVVPGGLPLPFGAFPETNVRTYVVGPDGGRGVYFHSLDITRWAPTVVARLGYRLPYAAARMRLARRGDRIAYRATRRWPAPRGATSHAIIEVGEPRPPAQQTSLDVFLSARWSLYAPTPRGHVLRARVDHAPWPLRTARVLHLDDRLVAAAGYDLAGRGPDHVLAADAVEVAVGVPERVG